jgi:DNA-binding NarL/FixJ family response regulator
MAETIYIQEDGEMREATEAELAQFEIDREAEELRVQEQEAKATARESALAKLAALGLTEEEIAAL